VHHLVSPTSGFLYDKTLNATMKIGLSATPFSDKEDSILVEERTGKVIYEVTYSELIKEGYLMQPYIYMYKLPKLPDDSGTYPTVYNKAIVNNEFLSDLIKGLVTTLNGLGKSVVVQTDFISHTKELSKKLSCPHLTGQDKTEKRKQIIQDLQDKKILCLVSTLFEEGLDINTLDYTINLAGGLSNISTFQRMRSITAHESKTSIGIIDFIHQCKYLKKHSKKRMDLYLSEPEFVVEIRDVSKKTISEIFS
jgi:superfamily II DNA or RNA helicase